MQYVYVLSNPSMPGLYKIAFTTRTPEERARELSNTGVPKAFVVESSWPFKTGAEAAGKSAHRHFDSQRVDQGREFFAASLPSIIQWMDDNYGAEAQKRRAELKQEQAEKVKRKRELLLQRGSRQSKSQINYSLYDEQLARRQKINSGVDAAIAQKAESADRQAAARREAHNKSVEIAFSKEGGDWKFVLLIAVLLAVGAYGMFIQ